MLGESKTKPSCDRPWDDSSNLRGARSTSHDVRSAQHGVRSTEWPFVGTIRCLARYGGSPCALPSLPGLSSGMDRKTRAQEAAVRAEALRAAQREPVAATPSALPDGESPSHDVLLPPPPGLWSADPSSSAAGSPASDASLPPPPGAVSGSAGDGGGGRSTWGGCRPRARLPGGVRQLRQRGQAL